MPSIWIAYCISVIRRSSHAGVEGDRVANPAVPGSWFRSRQSREPRSIQRNAIAKGANGEPAVLPGVLIVVCGLISKETELHAKGAFAIDSPPPGDFSDRSECFRLVSSTHRGSRCRHIFHYSSR